MTSPNGLICFTNCLLPLEDGSLVQRDLWIDERRGVILDAQRTFFLRKQRPERIIDLEGNILSPGLIDIQINGAYGFDFSVYDGDDEAYRSGLKTVAERIVETGVTSLVPTIITQEKTLYPKILNLLRPYTPPSSANLLGWHAEGPFIQLAKRGAHAPPFIIPAPEGLKSFENVYGPENLSVTEDWLMAGGGEGRVGVRMITAAPEIEGVMDSVEELSRRGVVCSIGHSIATTDIATTAVLSGARLITHLFNAMPQLHHRDPSIIGLIGASPHASAFTPITSPVSSSVTHNFFPHKAPIASTNSTPPSHTPSHSHTSSSLVKLTTGGKATSEAFDDHETPPQTPMLTKSSNAFSAEKLALKLSSKGPRGELHLEKGRVADMAFERPFYELIVDGIHSHPNSIRLAYGAYPEGCILITDAMKILDPNLRDGVHEWRDGKRFVKEGDKLYLEGTTTLAGSVVTLGKCVRNFSKFTGCSLGEAIKCATYNPAKCLGIENKKGTLRSEADADLVVLDRKGNVVSTWVGAKEVWRRDRV
ncbi:carbohydrate esterase family 9 protein [Jaapia argillacea MUCL 33604]|uniref:Carbohydrate esterase family 9 protein n=1 Tax=Jaapia argillacea MUCL 33604 TaxID=933084 RepID=A0A067PIM9_9AGAM|nr:carbohydrate esterase family 9 protein [Jaapia argillacea MUCL 33604]